MRSGLASILLLFVLGPVAFGQEPAGNQNPGGNEEPKAGEGEEKKPEGKTPEEKKVEEPKEAPVFTLPEKERKALAKYLADYLFPKNPEARGKARAKIDKVVAKQVGGHSVLEDPGAITDGAAAARLKYVNTKLGRKGRINLVEVPPAVHGFPGGVGTVKYHLYLPKNYKPSKGLSPLILALPDNKEWEEGDDFIKEVWLRSAQIAENYIIVVPVPQKKRGPWSSRKSYARAMIALRHAVGNFEQAKKTGGPASDQRRVFIDGGNVAAATAARFPEMFVGAILRGSNGTPRAQLNMSRYGGLALLPAYCVVKEGKTRELKFAAKVKVGNDLSELEEVPGDGKLLGDADKIAAWMEKAVDKRSDHPAKISYTIYDPSFQRHYWINILDYDATYSRNHKGHLPGFRAEADRARNVVEIDSRGLLRFELFLNDALVDLNSKVKIVVVEEEEMVFSEKKEDRSVSVLLDELVASNQPWRAYTVRYIVDVPALRKRHEEMKAKKKAEEEKKEEEKKEEGK